MNPSKEQNKMKTIQNQVMLKLKKMQQIETMNQKNLKDLETDSQTEKGRTQYLVYPPYQLLHNINHSSLSFLP